MAAAAANFISSDDTGSPQGITSKHNTPTARENGNDTLLKNT